VMAQVDHHLTKVNTVDLPIRVNNSGWKPGASQRSWREVERPDEDDDRAEGRSSDPMRTTTETPGNPPKMTPELRRAGPIKLNKHQVGVSICRI
jgi:hypothetical protein